MNPQKPNKPFLIGQGDKLTHITSRSNRKGKKALPYTYTENKKHLAGRLAQALENEANKPRLALPKNRITLLFELHPDFIASSYFPSKLFRTMSLDCVGSKISYIEPRKVASGLPKKSESIACFVNAPIENYTRMMERLKSNEEFTAEFRKNIIGTEEIRSLRPGERLRQAENTGIQEYEIILHASSDQSDKYIFDGFRDFLMSLGIEEPSSDTGLQFKNLFADKLIANANQMHQFEQFSFLRFARPVSRLAGLPESWKRKFQLFPERAILPSEPPINPSIRAAILDGGLPAEPNLSPWVSHFPDLQLPEPEGESASHGLAVTSSAVFGPIQNPRTCKRPLTGLDHYQVYSDDETSTFDILHRIKKVLSQDRYEFFCLTSGPPVPILDEDPIHPWTIFFDEYMSDGKHLGFFAAGNNGKDNLVCPETRCQIPSDLVNGLVIGACKEPIGPVRKASYSAVGPGRCPGMTRPDVVAFGGEQGGSTFDVLTPGNNGLVGVHGTSVAAPFAMKQALGVRTVFGSQLRTTTIKALLIHRAETDPTWHRYNLVGHGRIPGNIESLLHCEPYGATVVYQGTLARGELLRAPIPLPPEIVSGDVRISTTICFATKTDSAHPPIYTRSGLEVYFRPDERDKDNELQMHANTKSFFRARRISKEIKLRRDIGKWENVRHASGIMDASMWDKPCIDMGYLYREKGILRPDEQLDYSLIVTIENEVIEDLASRVLLDTRLEQLVPQIEPLITLEI